MFIYTDRLTELKDKSSISMARTSLNDFLYDYPLNSHYFPNDFKLEDYIKTYPDNPDA
jgi:outer membrane protein assembly factor BamD (BamD/ComL family)